MKGFLQQQHALQADGPETVLAGQAQAEEPTEPGWATPSCPDQGCIQTDSLKTPRDQGELPQALCTHLILHVVWTLFHSNNGV